MRDGRGWYNEPMRHSLAARGISSDHNVRVDVTRRVVLNDKYILSTNPVSTDDDYFIITKKGKKIKVFYMTLDESLDFKDHVGDGMGEMIRGDDHRNRALALDILEDNPYAIVVSVYSHGGEHWFLPEDRMPYHDHWDTAEGGGVWYPDDELVKHLDSFPVNERKDKAKRIAKSFLNEYNAFGRGEVYTLWMDVFDIDGGEPIESDNIGAIVGTDYAEQQLKEGAKNGYLW